MKRKETSTTGKQTPKATPSCLGTLPADDPIYKRGFAIGGFFGGVRSTPSPKSTQAPASPGTKPNSTHPATIATSEIAL